MTTTPTRTIATMADVRPGDKVHRYDLRAMHPESIDSITVRFVHPHPVVSTYVELVDSFGNAEIAPATASVVIYR